MQSPFEIVEIDTLTGAVRVIGRAATREAAEVERDKRAPYSGVAFGVRMRDPDCGELEIVRRSAGAVPALAVRRQA